VYIYSFADCSLYFVGELVDLGRQNKEDTRFGLYVLPESIQFSGTLLSVEAIGFRTDDMFQFNVLLYHQLPNASFQLYYENTNTTSYNKVLGTNYTFARVDVNASVTKGDRIGVQVVQNNGLFQPVFNASNCFAQVLFNAENDVNNLTTITNAFLNVQASIGKSKHCLCS